MAYSWKAMASRCDSSSRRIIDRLAEAVRQHVGLGCENTRLLRQNSQVDDSHPRCLFKRSPIVEISALLRQWWSRLFNYLRLAPELPFK